MNKTLDFQRLGAVIRWDILTNWKGYMTRTMGLAIGLSIYSVLQLYLFRSSVGIFNDEGCLSYFMQSKFCTFFICIAFFLFFISASNIFGNMKTKLQREGYLMLPANKIEKYVSRFLLMTIGSVIMIFIALIISDAVQFIFSFFVTPGFHASTTWETFRYLFEEDNDHKPYWEIVCFCISFSIFVHSFFSVGGSFYRKYPVLLTTVSAIILSMIFGYVINEMGEAGMLDFLKDIDMSRGTTASYCFTAFWSILFLIIATFNYWASYKIFTRMQVICNKWINL